MRLRDADLSTLWEGVQVRFEEQGKPLPLGWRLFYRLVRRVLMWGAA
jgi:hypothetical protein